MTGPSCGLAISAADDDYQIARTPDVAGFTV
jgi:hypothetical protein